jgi:LysM repeat protein
MVAQKRIKRGVVHKLQTISRRSGSTITRTIINSSARPEQDFFGSDFWQDIKKTTSMRDYWGIDALNTHTMEAPADLLSTSNPIREEQTVKEIARQPDMQPEALGLKSKDDLIKFESGIDIPESEPAKTAQEEETFIHYIGYGETLGGIVKKYGTTVEELVRLNNLKSKDHIRAGEKLRIPGQPLPENLLPYQKREPSKIGDHIVYGLWLKNTTPQLAN